MPKSPKQKQKLLLLADYFKKNTDENHSVTTPQLIDYLAANDVKAERKSIYDDVEVLKDFGMDIIKVGGSRGGYFLASRDFELAEVKLLVDIVQSSKFITTKKSRELIAKLENEVSHFDASKLHRQVVVADRNKAVNENIYYSVDIIYEAIANNSMIKYQYFEWDENKKQRIRKDGAYYEVSPWLLLWEDENYYLVAFDSEASIMKYYRVDKMLHLEMIDRERAGRREFEAMDVAAFSKKTFSMFAGEEKTVRLVADNRLTSVLIDRFGQDLAIRRYDDSHVIMRANIEVSVQFFGWLAGLGNGIRIESPSDVADEYAKYIQDILTLYK